jgi:hypothetical protein
VVGGVVAEFWKDARAFSFRVNHSKKNVCFMLKMKVLLFFKTSQTIYPTKERYIPEDPDPVAFY